VLHRRSRASLKESADPALSALQPRRSEAIIPAMIEAQQ
jgi:hypothetical protein